MITFDSLSIDPAGCNLIEASAGTGKTYAIASLFVRLVIEDAQFKPENILVVTFTEAATKELRDRIRKRLREARDVADGAETGDRFLKELMSAEHPAWPGSTVALSRLDLALQSFDCAAISTIHGFCSRALQEHAFESGSLFDTELVTDQKPLINQIADDFWRRTFFAQDAPLVPLAEAMNWSPQGFAGFLKGKLTNPLLRIVPEFTPSGIVNIRAACRNTFDRLCQLWLTRRSEIEQILREHAGLSRNQNLYRTDVLPELITGMETFAERGTPYALFDGHKIFTARCMRENRLKKHDPPEDPFFNLWDELVVSVQAVAKTVYGELLEYAGTHLPERKNALNVRFFDDLLADLYHALGGPNGALLAERLRGKYRAALIDEFQDTDQIQYKIFRSVFREGSIPLFLIGDPKQAIYSFRGADIYAYLEAREDVPPEQQHTMAVNWRSSGRLVEAVNALFSLKRERPLVIDGLSYPLVSVPEHAEDETVDVIAGNRDPSPLQFWFFSRQEGEKKCIPINRANPVVVAAVSAEIAGLLADAAEGKATIGARAVVAGDIAVIVRGHKQARLIHDALQTLGIPAVVRSDQSIFATQEAGQLRTILNALSEPGQEGKVRAALATGIMGVSANAIARTFEPDGEAEWEQRLSTFREYHDQWKAQGFMTMFRTFLDFEGVRARLLSLPGGERSITNLLQCAELLHAEATAEHLGVDAVCTWFSEQVSAPPEGEEHQIRLESDEKAVKILTIHVSKGLEFPIVFCPFLWGGVIEGGETVVAHEGFQLVADYGSENFDQHRRAAMDEGLAENVRLLYVALTRAKYRCYVAWGRFRYSESSALAYLLHAPEKVPGTSPCEELISVMEGISDDTMIARIQSVASEGRIHLVVDPVADSTPGAVRRTEATDRLQCRTMTGSIASDWRVTSFSALIDGHATPAEFPDHDSTEVAGSGMVGETPPENSFLSFPKGAHPGTFLHAIFEKVDFSNASAAKLSELVAQAMETSPPYEKFSVTVQAMLATVLTAELLDGLRLSALQPGSWVQEMEFYFPLKAIDAKLLSGFFRKHGITAPVDLGRMAERLNFRNVQGMLLGFIDLVFCHAGKYYLLDWKSNHLGTRPEEYRRDNLARDMERKLYPLQYLIYTVALNRYLARRIPGYRYETHFGGVLYLYLRGIDHSCPGNGIYFDKPDAALVRELTDCLIDVEEVYHG